MEKAAPFFFQHDADIRLNELYTFSRSIFLDRESFFENSKHIARLLYNKSKNPNIPQGELLILLVRDIELQGAKTDALCILKIEAREQYLTISLDNGSYVPQEQDGIDLRMLQKAVLIPSEHNFILAYERTGSTQYWIDDFLQAKAVQTEKSASKFVSEFTKNAIEAMTDSSRIAEYAERIHALTERENLTPNDVISTTSGFLTKSELDSIADVAVGKSNLVDLDFSISSSTLAKAASKTFRKIDIVRGVKLLVENGMRYPLISVSNVGDEQHILIRMKAAKA